MFPWHVAGILQLGLGAQARGVSALRNKSTCDRWRLDVHFDNVHICSLAFDAMAHDLIMQESGVHHDRNMLEVTLARISNNSVRIIE